MDEFNKFQMTPNKFNKKLDKDIKQFNDKISECKNSIKIINKNKKEIAYLTKKYKKVNIIDDLKLVYATIEDSRCKPGFVVLDELNLLTTFCDYYFEDDVKHYSLYLEPFRKIKVFEKQYIYSDNPEVLLYDYSVCPFPELQKKQINLVEKEIKRLILKEKFVLSKNSYNYKKFETLLNFR